METSPRFSMKIEPASPSRRHPTSDGGLSHDLPEAPGAQVRSGWCGVSGAEGGRKTSEKGGVLDHVMRPMFHHVSGCFQNFRMFILVLGDSSFQRELVHMSQPSQWHCEKAFPERKGSPWPAWRWSGIGKIYRRPN